jgi:histone H1/5
VKRTLLLSISSIALTIAFALPAAAATTQKAQLDKAAAATPAKPTAVTVVPPKSAPTIVAAKAVPKKAEAAKKPAKAKKAKKAKKEANKDGAKAGMKAKAEKANAKPRAVVEKKSA